MIGKTTRSNYIYLNSETHADGLGRIRVSVPSEQFKVNPGEMQRLTIQSFEMPLYFHTINRTNRWFFWWSPLADNYTSIAIPEGTYSDHATLAAAISAGLQVVFHIPDVQYDAVLRRFTLQPGASMADQNTPTDPDGFFVTFYASNFPAPPGLTPEQFHQNTHEILGCIPSTIRTVNAFGVLGNVDHNSLIPPRLNTTDALLLRTPLQAHAYQTTNFELGVPEQNRLMGTNIVARFMLDHTAEIISYEDISGHHYQFYPTLQHLDGLQFYLTDCHGRPFGDLLPPYAANVPLPFSLSLRWDAVVPDPRPPLPAHAPFTGNYKNAITPLN